MDLSSAHSSVLEILISGTAKIKKRKMFKGHNCLRASDLEKRYSVNPKNSGLTAR